MARQLLKPPSGHSILSTMVNTGLLQLIMVVMVLSDKCTRAVPFQEFPAKKVHVLRRIPAACSNWDKAWAWLTKVDCGTKYRLDYVTEPPREIKQYKLEYVCCDGDTDCKKAANIHSSGFDSTDEKFLAIVLGSAAACVVIVIIVIAITFYTKKTRCYTVCDHENHVYASADGDETLEGNTDTLKSHPEDCESETDQKGSEVEYAEINDPRLPRYTDIFKESIVERKEDPFNRATAPPLYSAVTPQSYTNADMRVFASMQGNTDERIHFNGTNTESITEAADDVFEDPRQSQKGASSDLFSSSEFDPDALYYNVPEKKNKKKRSTSSSKSGSTSSNKDEIRIQKNHIASGTFSKGKSKKTKTKGSVSVEMMVRSCSASETIGETDETPLTEDNRRSATLDSVDVSFDSTHRNLASNRSVSSSSMLRSDCTSGCSVSDTNFRNNAIRNNSRQKPVRPTSTGISYDNSGKQPSIQLYAMNGVTPCAIIVNQLTNTPKSRPLTNAEILARCEPTPMTVACIESESLEIKQKNIQSPGFHVDCVCDPTCEECEQCCKYDRLQYQVDPDTASLHIYQCLDDVRRNSQELRINSPASSPNELEINFKNNIGISRQMDSAEAGCSTDRNHHHQAH